MHKSTITTDRFSVNITWDILVKRGNLIFYHSYRMAQYCSVNSYFGLNPSYNFYATVTCRFKFLYALISAVLPLRTTNKFTDGDTLLSSTCIRELNHSKSLY